MTDGKVKICVIGAGSMANEMHYPNLSTNSDVEIVAICDINIQALQNTSIKYSIPSNKCYGSGGIFDYQKMIEKNEPDGIFAIGDPAVMYPVWIWCLQNGFNLFIEKPMGVTLHQSEMLAYLADDKQLITQVNFQRRNSPLLVKMKKELLKYGPINHANCEMFKFGGDKSNYLPYFGSAGNMLNDFVHSTDTLRWICGGKAKKITSSFKRIVTPDVSWATSLIEFDNNSTGIIISNWMSGKRIWRVQMHSTGIFTDAEIYGKAYLYKDDNKEGEEYDAKEIGESDDLRIYGGFKSKNKEFIDSIKFKKNLTSSPFHDAFETMELTYKIISNINSE